MNFLSLLVVGNLKWRHADAHTDSSMNDTTDIVSISTFLISVHLHNTPILATTSDRVNKASFENDNICKQILSFGCKKKFTHDFENQKYEIICMFKKRHTWKSILSVHLFVQLSSIWNRRSNELCIFLTSGIDRLLSLTFFLLFSILSFFFSLFSLLSKNSGLSRSFRSLFLLTSVFPFFPEYLFFF